jgi:hypothetical protein
VMKLEKTSGIRTILAGMNESDDLEWECFKGNEADTIGAILGFEDNYDNI